MHAIGNRILENNYNANVLYVTSEKFTNQLINAIKDNKTEMFRNKYRNIDVLLIDDIQFIAGKDRVQEEFFHTFNTLREDGKQIIISSDKPPRDIEFLEDRLKSRFEWGLLADISFPDYETRLAILRKKAQDENIIIEELKICEEEYHKKHAIIIVSEKILDVEKLANRISEETGYSGRSIVLGHIQRGGSPVPEDRILASKMAKEAICLLEKRKSGLCICMKDNQIISKNIEEALIEKNENQDRLYQLFLDLA